MKVTIYTVPDCKFSQAEKDYLKLHNIAFEEKNLETNRDWLSEMLSKTNNFAGTPATEIIKDDPAQPPIIIKGFTPEEFDKALGFTPQTSNQQAAGQSTSVNVTLENTSSPSVPQPVVAPASVNTTDATAPAGTVAPLQSTPSQPPAQQNPAPTAQVDMQQATAQPAPTEPPLQADSNQAMDSALQGMQGQTQSP